MARKSERAKLRLTQQEKARLQKIAQSRTAEFREVQRANILIQYEEGKQIMKISKDLKINRGTVYKCIDKALAGGIKFALQDKPHGSEPIITPAAKAWVINLACSKPKDSNLGNNTSEQYFCVFLRPFVTLWCVEFVR